MFKGGDDDLYGDEYGADYGDEEDFKGENGDFDHFSSSPDEAGEDTNLEDEEVFFQALSHKIFGLKFKEQPTKQVLQ
jgi:hypothetical protein